MNEWEFFEEGDAIGVIRQCADGFYEIGCYTDVYREEYTCFFQTIDRDEAADYIEGEACETPDEAYGKLSLKAPPSLVEYGDPFVSAYSADKRAMISALRENRLWD